MDPDQDPQNAQKVCEGYQQMTEVATSKEKTKHLSAMDSFEVTSLNSFFFQKQHFRMSSSAIYRWFPW